MIEDIKNYTATGLRKLRAGKNESLECVSEKTGIDKGTISRYEKGNCYMSLDIIEKLLNYYGVSFTIFFTT